MGRRLNLKRWCQKINDDPNISGLFFDGDTRTGEGKSALRCACNEVLIFRNYFYIFESIKSFWSRSALKTK
jgi:hypothetical protein